MNSIQNFNEGALLSILESSAVILSKYKRKDMEECQQVRNVYHEILQIAGKILGPSKEHEINSAIKEFNINPTADQKYYSIGAHVINWINEGQTLRQDSLAALDVKKAVIIVLSQFSENYLKQSQDDRDIFRQVLNIALNVLNAGEQAELKKIVYSYETSFEESTLTAYVLLKERVISWIKADL